MDQGPSLNILTRTLETNPWRLTQEPRHGNPEGRGQRSLLLSLEENEPSGMGFDSAGPLPLPLVGGLLGILPYYWPVHFFKKDVRGRCPYAGACREIQVFKLKLQ